MASDQGIMLSIPLLPAGSAPITLILPTRTISADNWSHLHYVLDAMRPGLVHDEPDATPHDDDEPATVQAARTSDAATEDREGPS